jgi:broad specificity phosphatase PhoE
MKIYLLRHVESLSNKENRADSQKDVELSKKGQEDAQKLIPILNQHSFDFFIVSPLRRTLQTIQPFLEIINKPQVIVSGLTLERNLGKFTGTPMGTFQKHCDDNELDKISCRPQNGESIEDTYKRAKKLLAEIKQNYPHKSILICSSKNFLGCLEIAITGKNIAGYYSIKSFELGELRKFNL